MINNRLEVKEFNLKQIVENLNKIPRDGGAKFGDETQKLTPKQKKELMEKVGNFNEMGKILRCETAIMEMARDLLKITQLAESYALTESGDYFQSEIVKRDFKEVKTITKDFTKLSKECYGKLQQLNALFENCAQKLGRYYEIRTMDEITNLNASKDPNMDEIVGDECSSMTPKDDNQFKGKLNGEEDLGVN